MRRVVVVLQRAAKHASVRLAVAGASCMHLPFCLCCCRCFVEATAGVLLARRRRHNHTGGREGRQAEVIHTVHCQPPPASAPHVCVRGPRACSTLCRLQQLVAGGKAAAAGCVAQRACAALQPLLPPLQVAPRCTATQTAWRCTGCLPSGGARVQAVRLCFNTSAVVVLLLCVHLC